MVAVLLALPETVNMDHSSEKSHGCTAFVALISILGIAYGGCVALFYSIVFDVFGAKSYKPAFSLCFKGFAVSVIIGGLSSAYSFSSINNASKKTGAGVDVNEQIRQTSAAWFYTMAAGCVVGLLFLHLLTPVNSLVKAPSRMGYELPYAK